MQRPLLLLLIFSLSTLAFQSTAKATDDPNLREILNKHWDAMGGMRNWSKVESIQLNGTLERDGRTVNIVIVKKRPNFIRATVTLPIPGKDDEELQVIRAHDGKTAWTATRLAGSPEMKKEELPPEAAADLLADTGVLPRLIKLWREGAELTLLDSTEIQGEIAFAILAEDPDSMRSTTFYLSQENHKLLAFDTQSPTGEVNRTSLSEYVAESGIQIPTMNIVDSSITGRSLMKINSVKIGIGIYKEYFGIKQIETASAR